MKGYHNHIWNVLGARTLSMSGRQLFTIDNFRNTSRPLLVVLADPDSIFMRGLAKFKRRTLYHNITNDRSAVPYTTGISRTDPFVDMTKVKPNYLPGYDDVIVDPACPIAPPEKNNSAREALWVTFRNRALFGIAMAFFIPMGVVFFLINSAVQSFRSRNRIKLHESGRAGIEVKKYRSMPVLITDGIHEVRTAVEDVYENINSSQNHEYLRDGTNSDSSSEIDIENNIDHHRASSPVSNRKSQPQPISSSSSDEKYLLAGKATKDGKQFPTLALAPYQFAMIAALDDVGFRKYPVHIHRSNHSHAAIIVRTPGKKAFGEGWVVFRHWLEGEFLL